MEKPVRRSPVAAKDRVMYDRLAESLRRAMIKHRLSERKLAAELGVTIGTTQKYFRAGVHPMRIATEINCKLAKLLGISVDALIRFYETGDYESGLSFGEVVSWIETSGGAEHMSEILAAAAAASKRGVASPSQSGLEPYTWPRAELDEAEVPQRLRERMGLSEERLMALEIEGVFDEELVEAFAVATNLNEESVRDAFERRVPVE